MQIDVTVSVPIHETPRVQQVCGIFDVPPTQKSERTWSVDLPLDQHAWNIGLIHGPSGCGKSTIARKLWGRKIDKRFRWSKDKAIVDDFPETMPVKQIVGLLSSVGFSSPPSWLRPYGCLSNGEQFRVSMARLLAESPDLAVVDEFTSIVDRTVAQVGSAAIAKTIRRREQQFVAVSCHDDIIDWLDPDWTFCPADGQFKWRLERRGRPQIKLDIQRVDRSQWTTFAHHHYLSHDVCKSAACFCASIEGRPAAFTAVMHFPHHIAPSWREHRTVCLPDFQGVGIGNAMSELIAAAYAATGKRFMSTTSHPAMIHHRARSPAWKMLRKPSVASKLGHTTGKTEMRRTQSTRRITAGFVFCGRANKPAAQALGVL